MCSASTFEAHQFECVGDRQKRHGDSCGQMHLHQQRVPSGKGRGIEAQGGQKFGLN